MGTHGVKNFPEPPHGPHLLAQLSDKPNFLYVTQEVVVMGSCSHVTFRRTQAIKEEPRWYVYHGTRLGYGRRSKKPS